MFSKGAFEGKVAFITGGSGYIGSTFCRKFVSLGGKCILVDKVENKSVGREPCLGDGSCLFIKCDLLDPLQRQTTVDKVKEIFLKVDIVINNASYTGDSNLDGWVEEFENQSLDAWTRALEVNLTAAFDFCQRLVPLLKKSESPSVINIGSIYGTLGPDFSLYENTKMGNPGAYGVSKAGLHQLTKYLAVALAPDIRVNSISPGGLVRGQPNSFKKKYIQKTPMRRMATEEDVVNAILFFSSDLASYITGQNLLVDGGLSIS